eukprot:4319268-Pyramimonas_sp.AAC.1
MLEPAWGCFGKVASWGPLGALWGSWDPLGASWGCLGRLCASWGPLGALLGAVGALLRGFGSECGGVTLRLGR